MGAWSGQLWAAWNPLQPALDDELEASLPFYPHPRSAQVMTVKRKIGIGVCGLADLLLAARLPG